MGLCECGVANGVILIDPLTGAKPIFEDILQVGRRPVHIYRDPTDGQVIWTMIDGDATTGLDDVTATIPDTNTVVDCSATGGGAVTIIHNSHIRPPVASCRRSSGKSVFMLRGTRSQPSQRERVFPSAHLCPAKFPERLP